MMSVKTRTWAAAIGTIACTGMPAGCAGPETQPAGAGAGTVYSDSPAQVVTNRDADRYAQYGRVSRIDEVPAERRTSGAGALIGGGTGRTAATVAGAVGGAVVGNSVEKDRTPPATAAYDVHVRLASGESRVITVVRLEGLSIGERVRIEGANIVRL